MFIHKRHEYRIKNVYLFIAYSKTTVTQITRVIQQCHKQQCTVLET